VTHTEDQNEFLSGKCLFFSLISQGQK
jgi:hypothetical protein